jgi:hypothetical protein
MFSGFEGPEPASAGSTHTGDTITRLMSPLETGDSERYVLLQSPSPSRSRSRSAGVSERFQAPLPVRIHTACVCM